MTARIATEKELRDLGRNFDKVMFALGHYFANNPSRDMAWTSAQSDQKNAAQIYAAIARSL